MHLFQGTDPEKICMYHLHLTSRSEMQRILQPWSLIAVSPSINGAREELRRDVSIEKYVTFFQKRWQWPLHLALSALTISELTFRFVNNGDAFFEKKPQSKRHNYFENSYTTSFVEFIGDVLKDLCAFCAYLRLRWNANFGEIRPPHWLKSLYISC